jgi:hypothetical protein
MAVCAGNYTQVGPLQNNYGIMMTCTRCGRVTRRTANEPDDLPDVLECDFCKAQDYHNRNSANEPDSVFEKCGRYLKALLDSFKIWRKYEDRE